jgi:hypothetical protein
VALFLLVVNGVGVAYWAADVEMSAGLQLLLRALAIVVFWKLLEAECSPYRTTFPLDMGFFLYATSFAALPYYLWRTQRWRGIAKTVLVIGLWLGSYGLVAALAWLAGAEGP